MTSHKFDENMTRPLKSQNLSKVNVASVESFNTLTFDNFVEKSSTRWMEVIEDWITYGTDVHFIFFEDFSYDPISEISKLLVHLGITADKNRLACLAQEISGSFQRESHHSKVPFSQEHQMQIDRVIERADKLFLNTLGYGLPKQKYEEYNENNIFANKSNTSAIRNY